MQDGSKEMPIQTFGEQDMQGISSHKPATVARDLS